MLSIALSVGKRIANISETSYNSVEKRNGHTAHGVCFSSADFCF